MLGRLLGSLLTEILLFLLLPFLALGFLLKKLVVVLRSLIPRRWTGAPVEPEMPVPAPVRRLVFARAIEAYEELIDMTAQAPNHRTPRAVARVR